MKTVVFSLGLGFLTIVTAPGMGCRDLKIGGILVAGLNPSGFDNDAQTDAFGAEDTTTVTADLEQIDFGVDFAYQWTLKNTLTGSLDLTSDMDVTLGDTVHAKFEIFSEGFQRLSYVRFLGSKLTNFRIDYSLTVESYPYVEFDVESVVPALSLNDPLPWTAGLCVMFYYDGNPNDAMKDKGRSVVVTNAPPVDLGSAKHSSSSLGLGLALSYSGLSGKEALFDYYMSGSYVRDLGATDFSDLQGAINGRTPPSGGFTYEYRGSPSSLGIDFDLGTGVAGEIYGSMRIRYSNWDGGEDVQLGFGYAPRDNDSDGLPNDWEDANGMNKNMATDALVSDKDHDLYADYFEYLAGTDPSDAKSLLRISHTMYRRTSDEFMLEWESVSGKSYDIEYLPKGAMNWMPLSGGQNLSASKGATTSHVHEDASAETGGTALYRVGLRVSF